MSNNRKATRGRKVKYKPKLKRIKTKLGDIYVKDDKSMEKYVIPPTVIVPKPKS